MSQSSLISKVGTILRRNKKGQNEVVNRINEISRSTDQQTNTLLALMIGATAELSLGSYLYQSIPYSSNAHNSALTNVLNLYLDNQYSTAIAALATSSDAKDNLHGYVREALSKSDPNLLIVMKVTSIRNRTALPGCLS